MSKDVKWTECVCDGEIIRIADVYKLIDETFLIDKEMCHKLKRNSKDSKLFCKCGCGTNLIFAAGKIRRPYFKTNGIKSTECHYSQENGMSLEAHIMLNHWFKNSLKLNDIKCSVPICSVDKTVNRRFEFSFLSMDKRIALNYWKDEKYISDEKVDVLENNVQDIKIIHVVDDDYRDNMGQYPYKLMKIQDKQGYCIFLKINNQDDSKSEIEYKAEMKVIFYYQDIDEKWKRLSFAEGELADFSIDDKGYLCYKGESFESKKSKAVLHVQEVETQRKQLYEKEKRRMEIKRANNILSSLNVKNRKVQQSTNAVSERMSKEEIDYRVQLKWGPINK